MTENCEAAPLLTSIKTNQCFMTEACLYYILSYEESEHKTKSTKDFDSFPLLAYACEYWSRHRASKHALYLIPSRQSPLFPLNSSSKVPANWDTSVFIKHELSNDKMEQPPAMEYILAQLFTLSDETWTWPYVYEPSTGFRNPPRVSNDHPPITAVSLAAYHGLSGIVELLLNNGQDIEEQGEFYGTPLLVACFYNHPDVVRILLNHGANIEQCKPIGFTPLICAINFGYLSIVELLLDRGAKIEQLSERNRLSALDTCAMHDQMQMATLVLDHSADLNFAGHPRYKPLVTASGYGRPELVKLFLDRGADVFERDYFGRTGRDMARKMQEKEKKGSDLYQRLQESVRILEEAEEMRLQEDAQSHMHNSKAKNSGWENKFKNRIMYRIVLLPV